MLMMREFRDPVDGRCNPCCQHRQEEKRWHDHVLSQRHTSLCWGLISGWGVSGWRRTLERVLFRGIACYGRFWGQPGFSPRIRFRTCCHAAGGIVRGQSDVIVFAQFELVADSGYLDADETI